MIHYEVSDNADYKSYLEQKYRSIKNDVDFKSFTTPKISSITKVQDLSQKADLLKIGLLFYDKYLINNSFPHNDHISKRNNIKELSDSILQKYINNDKTKLAQVTEIIYKKDLINYIIFNK